MRDKRTEHQYEKRALAELELLHRRNADTHKNDCPSCGRTLGCNCGPTGFEPRLTPAILRYCFRALIDDPPGGEGCWSRLYYWEMMFDRVKWRLNLFGAHGRAVEDALDAYVFCATDTVEARLDAAREALSEHGY